MNHKVAINFFNKCRVQDWKYNPETQCYDVNQDLIAYYQDLKKIPIPLGNIKGSVNFSNNQLNSFENFPKFISKESLDISSNKFELIDGAFKIEKLTSLDSSNNPIQQLPKNIDIYSLSLENCYIDDKKISGTCFKIGRRIIMNNNLLTQFDFSQIIPSRNDMFINLDNNKIETVFLKKDWNKFDLESLSLSLNRNKLSNIDFIKNFSLKIDSLSVDDNFITNVDLLKDLNNISLISIFGNPIKANDFLSYFLFSDENKYIGSSIVINHKQIKSQILEYSKTKVILENL